MRSPLSWARQMTLDGNDAGGEYDGDLGEWCLGGDNAGGEHDGDAGGV